MAGFLVFNIGRYFFNLAAYKAGNKLKIMETWKQKLNGNWNELKGKAKQQYADLTDDDLLYAEGKEDELLGRLQKKIGKSKDEVKDWIDKL